MLIDGDDDDDIDGEKIQRKCMVIAVFVVWPSLNYNFCLSIVRGTLNSQ